MAQQHEKALFGISFNDKGYADKRYIYTESNLKKILDENGFGNQFDPNEQYQDMTLGRGDRTLYIWKLSSEKELTDFLTMAEATAYEPETYGDFLHERLDCYYEETGIFDEGGEYQAFDDPRVKNILDKHPEALKGKTGYDDRSAEKLAYYTPNKERLVIVKKDDEGKGYNFAVFEPVSGEKFVLKQNGVVAGSRLDNMEDAIKHLEDGDGLTYYMRADYDTVIDKINSSNKKSDQQKRTECAENCGKLIATLDRLQEEAFTARGDDNPIPFVAFKWLDKTLTGDAQHSMTRALDTYAKSLNILKHNGQTDKADFYRELIIGLSQKSSSVPKNLNDEERCAFLLGFSHQRRELMEEKTTVVALTGNKAAADAITDGGQQVHSSLLEAKIGKPAITEATDKAQTKENQPHRHRGR